MFRVLVLLAVVSLIPTASARRKDQAKTVHATDHHKKYDARCSGKCLKTDNNKCTSNDEWKSFCEEWCDSSSGLCLTPDEKQDAVAKVPDPKVVEEKQHDDTGKTDDLEDEELEEDIEEPKPKPKPKPKPQPKEERCFPSDASVETPTGPKRMSELRVGDAVQAINGAGELFFDDVYFFGHADASVMADYVALKFADRTLELSDRHFVPTCRDHGVPCDWADHVHAYAQEVQPGDYVWTTDGNTGVQLHKVREASIINKEGLFNPYTLSGKIVVNGVVASAHSEWLLDSLIPSMYKRHLPAVYQAMFLPGRWLYHFVGPAAADVLDVNNPSAHGYGTEFLVACAGLFAGIVLAFPSKHSK